MHACEGLHDLFLRLQRAEDADERWGLQGEVEAILRRGIPILLRSCGPAVELHLEALVDHVVRKVPRYRGEHGSRSATMFTRIVSFNKLRSILKPRRQSPPPPPPEPPPDEPELTPEQVAEVLHEVDGILLRERETYRSWRLAIDLILDVTFRGLSQDACMLAHGLATVEDLADATTRDRLKNNMQQRRSRGRVHLASILHMLVGEGRLDEGVARRFAAECRIVKYFDPVPRLRPSRRKKPRGVSGGLPGQSPPPEGTTP